MLRVTLWGTRGTVPAPGPGTVGYGGNTPCVEVEAGPDRLRIVLDAGTGARLLGLHMATEAPRTEPARLFLTHFHWDHIQGLPFLLRSLPEAPGVDVRAPGRTGEEVEHLLGVLTAPAFFPLAMSTLGARVRFGGLVGPGWLSGSAAAPDQGTWDAAQGTGELRLGTARVRWMQVHHPSATFAYRIEEGGGSLVYAPDNELGGGGGAPGQGWPERFRRFVQGADLLVHDAMYTREELGLRRGWGHSSMEEAVDLALETGVGRLLLFHHAPEREDAELAAREEGLRARAKQRVGGCGLDVAFAVEGRRFEVEGVPA